MPYAKYLFLILPFMLVTTPSAGNTPIRGEVSPEACDEACRETYKDFSKEDSEEICEWICRDVPPPPPTPSTAVLLAQMCVAEISWQAREGKPDTLECELMIEINYRNAKRNSTSVVQQTQRFNAYFKNPDKQRPWIQYLNAASTKPTHWPRKAASWKVHRKYWEAYLKVAKDYPKKSRRKWHRPLCIRADDYGGRCDDDVHACDIPKQKCALKISCLRDQTHQAYWNLECCRNPTLLKCS